MPWLKSLYILQAETIAAGAIVGIGGKKEEDTSGHVPETGSNPEKLDSSSEPSYGKLF